jgi:hypothetical protein
MSGSVDRPGGIITHGCCIHGANVNSIIKRLPINNTWGPSGIQILRYTLILTNQASILMVSCAGDGGRETLSIHRHWTTWYWTVQYPASLRSRAWSEAVVLASVQSKQLG